MHTGWLAEGVIASISGRIIVRFLGVYMYACKYVCLYACVHGCVYVCIGVYVHPVYPVLEYICEELIYIYMKSIYIYIYEELFSKTE